MGARVTDWQAMKIADAIAKLAKAVVLAAWVNGQSERKDRALEQL